MIAKVSSLHQSYNQEKKSTDVVEKDIRKWVESVVEFKANLDKQNNEPSLERHLRKLKKFKVKKKPSLVTVQVNSVKNISKGQRKNIKTKKVIKKVANEKEETPRKKEHSNEIDTFDEIKESYRNLKLPQNWTSGISNGRVVFNRIKVTTYNSQQKMAVERSLVITKDRILHVLINGSEIALINWQLQKIDTVEDIKKAIKDIDSLKICNGSSNGPKSPQCSTLIDSKQKACQACKSETNSPQKPLHKKPRGVKKQGKSKTLPKQKSFQM